jgi:glucose/arabinose dehydrogenase
MRAILNSLWFSLLFLITSACSESTGANSTPDSQQDSGLELPADFEAQIFVEETGNGRHLASRSNGDIYQRLGAPRAGESIVALRDTNADGKADLIRYFGGNIGGTGIAIYQGYLYYSTDSEVLRQKFQGDELIPSGPVETVLSLPTQNQHAAKPITFDEEGHLYVTIGAPSNACQDPSRTAGVPGQDPCPLLENSGGIWRFSATTLNQGFEDGLRYATGIRHAVGITWNKSDGQLYAMQHGRDQLHQFWPEHFSQKQSAELPAEEMFRIKEGDDFGWPYCYYDWQKDLKLLNPEYGGDGDSIGRCKNYKRPIMAFPGHWAPNALQFYQAQQFPPRYRDGAFIAFHGSWNRAPFPQQGYRVVFVPFSGGEPIGGFDSFATGFAGKSNSPQSPGEAEYRPCGLTVGADGCLYISDSVKGRIWRVRNKS